MWLVVLFGVVGNRCFVFGLLGVDLRGWIVYILDSKCCGKYICVFDKVGFYCSGFGFCVFVFVVCRGVLEVFDKWFFFGVMSGLVVRLLELGVEC